LQGKKLMQNSFSVKFWGVRGSHPAPGAGTVHFGGNTACVEIQAAGKTIVIDAGTGIIPLGRELSRRAALMGTPVSVTLLLSHLHHDHTQGLPFFVPMHSAATQMTLIGPDFYGPRLEDTIANVMHAPAFPMEWAGIRAEKSIQSIHTGQVLLLGDNGRQLIAHPSDKSVIDEFISQEENEPVIVKCFYSHTHPNGVMCFRVEWKQHSVVYASDVEGGPDVNWRLAKFARGADLLIYDAQYTDPHYLGLAPGLPATKGWGHSTVTMAAEFARDANAKQLALFHHEPAYEDWTIAQNELDARKRFSNTLSAYEGLEIILVEAIEEKPEAIYTTPFIHRVPVFLNRQPEK
jgi:phosphoribosyl 1,2-cyclic phosphodiesterase